MTRPASSTRIDALIAAIAIAFTLSLGATLALAATTSAATPSAAAPTGYVWIAEDGSAAAIEPADTDDDATASLD